MQGLYTKKLNPFVTPAAQKKNLLTNIHTVNTIFIQMIYVIRQLANYCNEYQKIVDDKLLKTSRIDVNKSFLNNPLIQHFNDNEDLQDLFKSIDTNHIDEDDLIKKLYHAMIEREDFKEYLETADKPIDLEWKIMRVVFKKVVLKSDVLASMLEEKYITWQDDRNTVINMVIATINEFYKHKDLNFEETFPKADWDDLDEYAVDLYKLVDKHREELDKEIEPLLENWEMERVNLLDLILVRMAMIELMHFPNIPIKVSLNEYVEISKVYSTPKSKEFINGILDKLMKKLSAEGKVKKSGRGLME